MSALHIESFDLYTRNRPKRGLRALKLFLIACCAAIMIPTHANAAAGQGSGALEIRKPITPPSGFVGACSRYDWLCARGAGGSRIAAVLVMDRAREINAAVNRSVRQISDPMQYGVAERWALPTKRGGDCEDLAMLKKLRLIQAGVPPQALLLASVLDHRKKSHLVLVLRTDQGDVVLDNLTSRIKPWHQTGYKFIRMQNPDNPARWNVVARRGLLVS